MSSPQIKFAQNVARRRQKLRKSVNLPKTFPCHEKEVVKYRNRITQGLFAPIENKDGVNRPKCFPGVNGLSVDVSTF